MKFKEISSDSYKLQLFFLLLASFASAILGDSTAEALLLSNYDASIIPRMFLINAFVLFLISSIMMTVIDIVDRGTFFLYGLIIHSVILTLFRGVIEFKWPFLFPLLFSYAYITKILMFMLFWTLANDLVDSRKAGKVFPIIAAGGTLGAVGVSFSIPSILKIIPPENLIIVWSILIIAAIILFIPVKRKYGRHFQARTDRKRRNIVSIIKDLQLFREEPLLRNMGILYFSLFFLLLNQHYIFYGQVKKHFLTAGGVASFLGYFNGISMVSTFVLQMTIAGIVLKKFGSTRSMLLIPSVLTVLFASLFIISFFEFEHFALLFYAIIFGMGLRIAFFDSFFSPNFQIFFSSLPQEIRGRSKLTMEGVVKPCAMVLSGIWLIWAGKLLSFQMQMGVLFSVALFTIFQAWRIKGRYADSLTNYLTGFSGKKDDAIVNEFEIGNNENIIRQFGERIPKEEPGVQKFLIELISTAQSPESSKILVEYFYSGDSQMRANILSAIRGTAQKELYSIIEQSLYDEDFRVVANAILTAAEIPGMDFNKHLSHLINHYHPRVRANCIFTVWKFSNDELRSYLLERAREMLYKKFPDESASVLYALGEMDGDLPFKMICDFINCYNNVLHMHKSIFNQTVRALSKKKSLHSVQLLLQFAKKSSKTAKAEICKCLSKILQHIDPQQLWNLMKTSDHMALNLIVSAIHQNSLPLHETFEHEFRYLAEKELSDINMFMRLYSEISLCNGNGAELLGYALLEEHIDIRINTLIHIASILDKTHRIRKIIPRLFHNNSHMRARAFEVMDNTGDSRFNRNLIDILEVRMSYLQKASDFSHKNMLRLEQVNQFINDSNEWVAQCARFALGEG